MINESTYKDVYQRWVNGEFSGKLVEFMGPTGYHAVSGMKHEGHQVEITWATGKSSRKLPTSGVRFRIPD
jgi:hypothetical protein